MYNCGKSLLEHINIEYQYGHVSPYASQYLICEEFGFVPNLKKYVGCFMKALPKVWQSGKWYFIGDRDFQDVENPFFKDLLIQVKLTKDEENFNQHVRYHAEDRDFIDSQGKLHSPRITMEYITYDSDMKDQLRSDFAHEFTHMYENYIRRKNGKESLQQTAERTRYFDYADIRQATNPKASVRFLKQFLYWTNEQEQNAHIGTLKAELEPYTEELQSSRKFEDFLQKSRTYKDYKVIEKYVNRVFIRQDLGPKAKENMLQAFISIFPVEKYKVDSYEKLARFCLNRWKKWDMKFKNRLSKIIGSLYESTVKIMDGPYCRILGEEDFNVYWEK